MKFPRESFKNTPEECAWLSDTHLSELLLPEFASFTLYGGENNPSRIDFYEHQKPEYNHLPNYILIRGEDGEWLEIGPPD